STAVEMHRRAAQWMLAQGEPIESIRHSILANDLQGAGRTLLSVLVRVLSLEGPALAAAIEPLARTAPDNPSLTSLLAAAGCHYHRQEMGAMLRDATDAKAFLDTAGDDRAAAEILIALFELAAARVRGDSAGTWKLADHALAIIDRTPPQELPTGRGFRAVALVNRAGAEVWTGIRPDTAATLVDMSREAAELGLLLPHVNAMSHVALIDALHSRCTAAHNRATETLRFADRRGWRSQPQVLGAVLTLALVDTSRHDVENAARWVSRGLAAGGKDTDRALRLALAVAAVQVAVGRGDVTAALTADARAVDGLARTPDAAPLLRRWSGVAGAEALLLAGRPAEAVDRIIGPGTGDDPPSAWERVALARARIALGDMPAAQLCIEPLLRPAPPVLEPAISAALLQALIADRGHRDSAALAAVTLAIDLAFNEGIKRPFVLIGGRIAELLIRYRNLGGRHDAFAAELVELLRPTAGHRNGQSHNGSEPMMDPLTERETIVLHYLPTMLKAGEIADDLYVSVNTVKAHLRAIYRKLGVANRRDAVERARTSGLL
ncbi:LuxR C-terminal-related transcriptional regulator, partial [Nakamurella sp. GG22]